jgi:hypothetical protein
VAHPYTYIHTYIHVFFTASRPALGHTQPPTQWVPGFFPGGVKRLRGDADNLPHLVPTSGMVELSFHYHIRDHGVVPNLLIKHRENFNFTFFITLYIQNLMQRPRLVS